MLNAIIISKMMHGLETLVMNTSVLKPLDAFQLKGLRKLLKVPTTDIDHKYFNDCVKHEVNLKLKTSGNKPIVTRSEYHKQRRVT